MARMLKAAGNPLEKIIELTGLGAADAALKT
jgi:hypothetical protein